MSRDQPVGGHLICSGQSNPDNYDVFVTDLDYKKLRLDVSKMCLSKGTEAYTSGTGLFTTAPTYGFDKSPNVRGLR